jgi:hypothetical protein
VHTLRQAARGVPQTVHMMIRVLLSPDLLLRLPLPPLLLLSLLRAGLRTATPTGTCVNLLV